MDSAPERNDDGNPVYTFRASASGAPRQFVLTPDALHWQIGSRAGQVAYGEIRAIRLSYRPVTMQSHRFVAEIWPPAGRKVQIVSVSWRGMMEQQRLDAAYSAFIAELHRRIAASGGSTQFIVGLAPMTYWAGVVLFAAVMLAAAALVVRAARLGQWSASLVFVGFLAVFGYQIGNFFGRNRPSRYRPDALPASVLPKADV